MERFSLALALFGVIATLAPSRNIAAAACTPRPVTCGTTVTDSLGPSSSCIIDSFPTGVYSFNGAAGQILNVVETNPSGHNAFIELTDSSGKTVTTSYLDDPAAISVTLPKTDQYTISVNFGNPHISSAFTLTVSCSTTTTPPGACQYTSTIAVGTSLSGQLTSADTPCGIESSYTKAYRVIAAANDAFTVEYSASYPVFLEIRGPDRSGAYRLESGKFLRMEYIAPVAGNVTIYVASNTSTPVTGTYTLEVKSLSLPSCGKIRAVRH